MVDLKFRRSEVERLVMVDGRAHSRVRHGKIGRIDGTVSDGATLLMTR